MLWESQRGRLETPVQVGFGFLGFFLWNVLCFFPTHKIILPAEASPAA